MSKQALENALRGLRSGDLDAISSEIRNTGGSHTQMIEAARAISPALSGKKKAELSKGVSRSTALAMNRNAAREANLERRANECAGVFIDRLGKVKSVQINFKSCLDKIARLLCASESDVESRDIGCRITMFWNGKNGGGGKCKPKLRATLESVGVDGSYSNGVVFFCPNGNIDVEDVKTALGKVE